jgi:ABC-type nitrate/sulfonate/bicarbonate transport system substrate-binding protein
MEKFPEQVHAFRRAMIRAAEFANTHPQETRNILRQYVPLEKNILDTLVL